MRKSIILVVYLFFASVLYAEVNHKPFVVPEVKNWKGAEGECTVGSSSKIVINGRNPDISRIAQCLSLDWEKMFGQHLDIHKGKAHKGDIILSLDRKMGKEAYSITTSSVIKIDANTSVGLYWATRTLLQIAEQNKLHSIPCGTIVDEPDYEMRGFMIDCGRKYIPLDYLRNLVKVMAYYKMNTLQVHLNDNGFKQFYQNDWDKTYSAFRMESSTFLGLTAKDGYYTKREFHDFIKESALLGVEIIPEIDAPAHTLAFYHYNHELGSKEYGADHLDLTNPETYRFMDALWKEYLEGEDPVFCCPRVHIGTDEYSNRDQNIVEKFRYFTDYYIKYVEKYGKQACVWGALTHAQGTTPVKSENVLMSEWYNGYAEPKEMQKLGYELISIPDGWVYIVPSAGYYYDYLNCKALYEEWTPAHIGSETFPECAPYIKGGMFAVWNDHCGNGISISDIHHRVFPALQTIATKTWNPTGLTLSYEEYNHKLAILSEAPGVNELGRLLKQHGVVTEIKELTSNSQFDNDFIGYNYRVTFTVDAEKESLGTPLLTSSRSTFYLSDPVKGFLGYSRDGYLFTFNHKLLTGKHKYSIEGDNKSTRLYIDNILKEELNIYPVWYDKNGQAKMNQVRTLVFPLHQSGNFKSKVYDFIVEQL